MSETISILLRNETLAFPREQLQPLTKTKTQKIKIKSYSSFYFGVTNKAEVIIVFFFFLKSYIKVFKKLCWLVAINGCECFDGARLCSFYRITETPLKILKRNETEKMHLEVTCDNLSCHKR